LNGLEIVGQEEGDNVVSFKLKPDETKIIELRTISAQWGIKTALAYGI